MISLSTLKKKWKIFSRKSSNGGLIPNGQVEIHCSEIHMVILNHYAYYLRLVSDEEPSEKLFSGKTRISVSCAQEHKKYMFMVPKLNKLSATGSLDGINKYKPVTDLMSFLVRLLYHKQGSVFDLYKDQIHNLEKELRFLLTVLVDKSLMLCAEEFQNLLAEIEAVANEAGGFVHSLFFITDREFGEVDVRIPIVLNHIHILNADIIKLVDLVPSLSRSTYTTPKTSVVDSLLVVDSIIHDLEDLIYRGDYLFPDVKDQIKTLHQGLIYLQSSIKDIGSSEIGELKDFVMRIGDLTHEGEYLIISFLAGDAPRWYLVKRLIHINHKIELSGTELREITMKYMYGGLKVAKYSNKLLSSSVANRNTQENDDVICFEDQIIHILDQLVGGGAELRVISIFGMPGLGKTTLARKLYDHPSVNYRFDKLSWSVVSQTYSRRSVLTRISNHIGNVFGGDIEEENLAEHIYKTLKGRRYLIVLDDIWDSSVWDDLLRFFPNDRNGSRILFTTRNKDVAPSDYDQCWRLLEKKVFGNKHCCPPELIGVGKKIAAICRGVPLSVVVIAGVLSTMDTEVSTWVEVMENFSSYMFDGEGNSVMRILELSYKHLLQYLKPCFLYLGVFHEHQEIPIKDMVEWWIAEGFIHKEAEKNVNKVAEEYFAELIDKSLVMVSQRRSDGGIKTCVVHDLLRELCLKICEEEKLMRFVNNKHYKNNDDPLKVVQHSVTWSCCQFTREQFGKSKRTFQLEVPDMRLLRVLYFECSSIYLTGIKYFVSLKYLVIGDLSPLLSNLVNLEYLRVENDKTVYLTSTILNMKKLRHLESYSSIRYSTDCNTSLTNNLEVLKHVSIMRLKDEEMLECSPHLRKLKCRYPKKVYGIIDLSFLTQLESLSLFGEVFSLPSSLRKLTLISPPNKLSRKTMSMIGRLENLEVLKLQVVEFEDNRWDTRDDEFQKLKYLKLTLAEKLCHWNVESSEHFPKLEQLDLRYCYKLQEIPSVIGDITTMQMIKVEEYHSLKSLVESAKRIEQEQRDMGNEELRVIIT